MAEPTAEIPPGRPEGLLRRAVRRLRGLHVLEPTVHRLTAEQAQLRAELQAIRATLSAIGDQVSPDDEDSRDLATVLRDRFDHALLHAEALAVETRKSNERSLAEVRSAVRLAQAMAEQGPPPATDTPASAPDPSPAPSGRFRHPAPSFSALYRSFEDSHRGEAQDIRARQRADYGDVVAQLAGAGLPAVDLGCGRGELVELLVEGGVEAIGVDANQGQLVGVDGARFEQADLFDWLDGRDDESLGAVFSLHVIEHLPIELQVRLIFEARRVLAPGGVLVLETPNALSVTTAATNFWVDPTHVKPVHPMLLEFLAREAGFSDIELRPLHPIDLEFRGQDVAPDLVADLNSLLLGCGDVALVASR